MAATVGDVSLAAPELLRYAVGTVLRRQVIAGELSPAEATLAHEDLLELPSGHTRPSRGASRTFGTD